MEVFWKILGYAAIPLILAGIGNHLAADIVQDSRRRRMLRIWLWSLAGIGVAIVSGVEVTSDASHKKEVEEQRQAIDGLQSTLHRTEVRSASDMGYLKAKLEDALSKPGPAASDYEKAAKVTLALLERQSKKLSDKQLSQSALEFGRKMRAFEFNDRQLEERAAVKYQQQFSSAKPEDRAKIFNQETQELMTLRNAYDLEFRNTLLGEAVYLRDELERRIPNADALLTPTEKGRLIAFRGILAGVAPVSDAADYLEQLARKLSP